VHDPKIYKLTADEFGEVDQIATRGEGSGVRSCQIFDGSVSQKEKEEMALMIQAAELLSLQRTYLARLIKQMGIK